MCIVMCHHHRIICIHGVYTQMRITLQIDDDVLNMAKTPVESFALLASMTRLPAHVFLPDDVDLSRGTHLN